jgi:hypothetical protein
MDPNPDKYWVTFSFGPLMKSDGTIVSSVSSYKLCWVDSNGRKVSDILSVPAAMMGNCCNSMMYKVTVAGTFPTGYSRIAIMPVSSAGQMLPFTDYTDAVTDVTTGQVKKVQGNFTLQMTTAHANAMFSGANNGKAKTALSKAIADTLGAGVSAAEVFITGIYINGNLATRRLSEEEYEENRRLSSADVTVAYIIISTDTTKTIDATTLVPATLQTNFQVEARKVVPAFTITAVPVVNTPTSSAVEGTPVATAGAASLLLSLVPAIIAAGSLLMS